MTAAFITPRVAADLARLSGSPALSQLGSSCAGLTASLGGGLRRGDITAITGGPGSAKTLLAIDIISNELVNNTKSHAAVFDTTGNFSLLRLAEAVKDRLEIDEKAKDSELDKILQRVQYLRVFDVFGVVEGIEEVRRTCETLQRKVRIQSEEIPDSEDEDEEVDLDAENLSVVLIDTITNVIQPFTSKQQAEGQALLVSMCRALSTLSVNHDICTILLNTTINDPAQRYSFNQAMSTVSVSAFAVPFRPALGNTLAFCIDMHILLSELPKTIKDAEKLVMGAGEEVSTVRICEVIADREEGKGRWAPFEIADGKLKDVVI